MSERLDYLFAELDQQLNQTQQHANTHSQRSGLLISATALAAAVFVNDLDRIKTGEVLTLAAFGLAVISGIAALVPALQIGPNPASMMAWSVGPSKPAVTSLYQAKLLAIEANRARLGVMALIFYLQVLAVTGAVVAAIVVAAGR